MAILQEFAAHRLAFDTLDTPRYHLRRITEDDAPALFACYGDPAAVRLMNDDNCTFGFYMESEEQVHRSIQFWNADTFILRQCVVDRASGTPVGTLELCAREDGALVLRIDLRADCEREDTLRELIEASVQDGFAACPSAVCIVTKAIPEAEARRRALVSCGFTGGHQLMSYPHYYRLDRQ
jgi:RimJ/RimL family protein N-acetyltransferase